MSESNIQLPGPVLSGDRFMAAMDVSPSSDSDGDHVAPRGDKILSQEIAGQIADDLAALQVIPLWASNRIEYFYASHEALRKRVEALELENVAITGRTAMYRNALLALRSAVLEATAKVDASFGGVLVIEDE